MNDQDSSTDTDTAQADIIDAQDADTAPAADADAPLHLVGTTPHSYDLPAIRGFIDTVFHAPIPPGAHRLVYTARNNIPRLPNDVAGLGKNLRSGKARALYFNTSTCIKDPEGVLRHKKDLFSAMHVLVLDDVGTKIPKSKIPADMQPTYIIETSAGNFQYGYVLDTPITDIDHAAALVQTAAVAGLTDGGGLMATKVVRLPAGVNGKPGPKALFPVKLIDNTGPYWTPDLLVERMRCSVEGKQITWVGIQAGDAPITKKYRPRVHVHAQTAEGVIDELLEWLYENDMVMGDGGGDWVDIQCPWHIHHTSGDDSAGYAPVGRGEMTTVRGFKCFHDHCKNRTIVDFIQWVLANSKFNHLAIEEAGLNAADYAFDPALDLVWNIREGRAWKISGFRTMHNTPVWVYERKRLKPVKLTAAQAWLLSPYRTIVAGAYHSPGSPRLFEREDKLWVNTYRGPRWSDGVYDMAHVKPFLDFLGYLLPDDEERGYFIQWLAAKAQNPRFRGTGIIMQTQAFGTGRGTLGAMVNQIWQDKTAGIEFDTLVRSEGFNGWETAALVIVNEAKESTARQESKGAHKAYETLKQRMDTSVIRGKINEKFQPERQVDICSSYLMFTNHLNAVAIPPEDRRITVLTNPRTPASAQYFVDTYAWLEAGVFPAELPEQDQWAWHVWHWLREQPVDASVLALPWRTDAKAVMTNAAQTPVERACNSVGDYMTDNYLTAISTTMYKAAVQRALLSFDPDMRTPTSYMMMCMNEVTTALTLKLRTPNGASERVRIRDQVVIDERVAIPDWDKIRKASAKSFRQATKARFVADIAKVDLAALVDYIVDDMS